MAHDIAARSWDAEYASGRYAGDPPVGFVDDIITAAGEAGISRGLYIGCGNGRNYIPLSQAGLDLTGLDISATAISQLAARLSGLHGRLVTGDLSALPAGQRFPLTVAIQVLQHGTRGETHGLLAESLERVAPGGLFAVRVNAAGTDVHHAHEVTERDADGSYSVRYQEGPKAGLTVHFWAARELDAAVTAEGFSPLLPLRPQATWRARREQGLWLQWEGIYQRPA
ncbi:MAG TPA: class I SAM-dependent methyltransferase [Trebonia sp.]|nr:class I SAM-dependent methyltransferase [Trebonia sp.]